MAQSKAKNFEAKFKKNWADTVNDSLCYRLADQQSGYYGTSRNISDFICFKAPNIYFLELKSTKGNTFSVNFRQYEELSNMQKANITGVYCGVIIWFYEHDKVVYVPITTFDKLINEDLKSFNLKKMLGDPNYPSLDIPSKKLRTFMNSDYSSLINYVGCKDD